MNKLMAFLERYILPAASKIGSQKHLVAVRDSFIGTLPVTMAGAIAVLLNAFVRDFPRNFGWTGFVSAMKPVIGVNGVVWGGTIAILAIMFAASLGYNLAKAYEVEPLSGALVSLAAFIMGLTQSASTKLDLAGELSKEAIDLITAAGGTVVNGNSITAGAWGYLNFSTHMGGMGLFTVLIFGLISVTIFAKLMHKKIIIKMPDSVPPAVSKAFAAIIPALASLYVVGIIYYAFSQITGQAFINWITTTIQTPLMHLTQGFGAVLIIVVLVHLLWFFGLHGTNILAPVLQMLYGTAMNDNTNAFQQGLEIPYKWVAGSFEAFVWPGGAGVTIMLVLAIILLSRRADFKTIGKLSLAPGIFNINEPVMFGMPIVLNPIFMIPFILAPVATATISYWATVLGLVKPVVVNVIWVMPAIISAFLATAGDWRAVVLSIINLAVAFVIWAPFVLAANKMKSLEY